VKAEAHLVLFTAKVKGYHRKLVRGCNKNAAGSRRRCQFRHGITGSDALQAL